MLLVVGPEAYPHLQRAIAMHLQWCRRNGVAAPAELTDLLAALAARRGHERPTFDTDEAAVDGGLMTYAEAARTLAVSARTVRRMVADGRLPAVRVGGAVRVAVEDVEEVRRGA